MHALAHMPRHTALKCTNVEEEKNSTMSPSIVPESFRYSSKTPGSEIDLGGQGEIINTLRHVSLWSKGPFSQNITKHYLSPKKSQTLF